MNIHAPAGSTTHGEIIAAARRVLSLFDEPATPQICAVVLAAPALPGLTEPFAAAVPPRGLRAVLSRLSLRPSQADGEAASRWQRASSALLATGEAVEEPTGALSLVPALREPTRAAFAQAWPQSSREANKRLYLAAYAEPRRRQPETVAEMAALARAVRHAVRAGRTREAFDGVYLARAARGDACFVGMHLGAYDIWLDMLAQFYVTPWSTPSPDLTEEQVEALNEHASLALRGMGQISGAATPVTASLEAARRKTSRLKLALAAQGMSEVSQALGNLDDARKFAEESVTAAAQTGHQFRILSAQCRLADVLHQRGECDAALALFEEAEQRQRTLNKALKYLVSLRHAAYADLLLTLGRAPEVLTRGAFALSVSEAFQGDGLTPLDLALDHLVLGRAAHACQRAGTDQPDTTGGDVTGFARRHLDDAVERLRAPGNRACLSAGLVARAAFLIDAGDRPAAEHDLDDAVATARAAGQRLLLADALIERARLDLPQRATDIAEAAFIVDTCAYLRRRNQLPPPRLS